MPEGTPALPFVHNFYSATWTTDDEQAPDRLGPVQDADRPWVNGRLFAPQPPGQPFGRREQFAGDLTYPGDENTERLIDGITEQCWIHFGVPFLAFSTVMNLADCCLRAAYMRILELLYDGQFHIVLSFFTEWLGPGVTVSLWDEDGLLPAMAIVQSSTYSMVFVTGTTNFQQAATQAMTAFVGPRRRGNIKTMPLWFDTATVVMERMHDVGVNVNGEFLLVGHSYGAAVAAIVGVRIARPVTRSLPVVMTIGMPKTGDRAFTRRLERTCRFFPIVNQGDVVTNLPPSTDVSDWFPLIIGPAQNLLWNDWASLSEVMIQDADGEKRLSPPEGIGVNVLLPIVLDVFAGQPIAPIFQHRTVTYVARALAGCECPEGLMTQELWNFLFGIRPAGIIFGVPAQPVQPNLPWGLPGMPGRPRLPMGVPGEPDRPRLPMGVPGDPDRPRLPMGVPGEPDRPRLPMGVPGEPAAFGLVLGVDVTPAFFGLLLGYES